MINYDLRRIKAVVFDIDGVLSAETITMDNDGEPLRTINIKDGYAIQLACKSGLTIGIITGGDSAAMRKRYESLGVKDIFMPCAVKIKAYEEFKNSHSLTDEEIVYVGDDIPDYEVMSVCGCPCCPADACAEIKTISTYVSGKNGGHGCGRDVLEQVMKAQDLWKNGAKAFGW